MQRVKEGKRPYFLKKGKDFYKKKKKKKKKKKNNNNNNADIYI